MRSTGTFPALAALAALVAGSGWGCAIDKGNPAAEASAQTASLAVAAAAGAPQQIEAAVSSNSPAGEVKSPAPSPLDKPGFFTELDKDGRLWVFKTGTPELDEFKAKGKPAKHVVRPGAGPLGLTLKAVESETLVEYLAARPGFHVELDKDGRLWVFKTGTPELDEFKAKGKPAKHVVRPLAGPGRITIKAPDAETADAYLAAQ